MCYQNYLSYFIFVRFGLLIFFCMWSLFNCFVCFYFSDCVVFFGIYSFAIVHNLIFEFLLADATGAAIPR